jgi:hypothetical protein
MTGELIDILKKTGFFILAISLHSSGLDCMAVPSIDRVFADKWSHWPPGSLPYLARRDTVYAGLPWGIYVFFQGYARNDSGRADLSFSYKILKPNGKTFHDTAEVSAVSGKIGQDTGVLLSGRIPMFSFSQNEKPGTYKIILKAKDGISGQKKTKEASVVLSKYPRPAAGTFDDVSLNIWIHSYCLDPDPGRALSAFYYFIGSKLSDDNDIFWPVLYFFQCLFSEHPFLVHELVANFPACPQRLQEYTVFLLRAIGREKGSGAPAIPDSLWNKFDKVAENGFFEPFSYACKVRSNRFIEYAFYYYGRYDLIGFLAECLGLDAPAGYDAFKSRCAVYSGECPKSLDKETAPQFYSAARKILEKTCAKHPLVNAYCMYAYDHGNLGPDARKELGKIIAPPKK